MPILVSSLINTVKRIGIDSDNSDYYNDSRNFIPAINHSVGWLMAIISAAYSENKVQEEVLRELQVCKVYQTSSVSRITLTDEVWTILMVAPLPNCSPNNNIVTPNPNNSFTSVDRTTLTYLNSNHSAKRLTLEEWNLNKKNPFEFGNTIEECEELKEYAYLGHVIYSPQTAKEIEIRPVLNRKLCAVFYARVHPTITAVADFILFPEQVRNMLAEKVLQIVTRQQGDETNIYAVSDADIKQISSLFLGK